MNIIGAHGLMVSVYGLCKLEQATNDDEKGNEEKQSVDFDFVSTPKIPFVIQN